jgi:uncharacterized protein (DUF58 family)
LVALVLPVEVVAVLVLGVVVAVAMDAWAARRPPTIDSTAPLTLSRGVPSKLVVAVTAPGCGVDVRQAAPPDLEVRPPRAPGGIDGHIIPRRRGRHQLPPAAVRLTGPLGLGRWDHEGHGPAEVLVYPDLPAARRLALAVRQGRFALEGRRRRGPLGLGTEFEAVRDYSPDDDVRQINWLATARLERPMSNQFRIDQDRDVMVVIDTGRLMAAPVGDRTRLDAALDAAVAVALVADEVGDRCGALAFDRQVLRRLPPRRGGGRAVVTALFDLEPSTVESDYELAFRTVGGGKRGLVVVFTDLIEQQAAQPLVDAMPVLARRHAVVVASAADPDLAAMVATPPRQPLDAYAAGVAAGVLAERRRIAHTLTRAGATVVEAPPAALAATCVAAYLRLKARARA